MSTQDDSGWRLPSAAGTQDIAALREAQRTLELDAERRRAVAEASASILWSADAKGNILDMAPQWYAFTGQAEEHYRGDGWLDAVHPDDRALAAGTWSRALSEKTPAEAVYRLRHVSGQYRFAAVRYAPVFDSGGQLREWVGWITDIDARVRAERELDRFFALSLDLLCIAGLDGYFKRVNPAFERTLGFTADELRGGPFIHLVHPEDCVATLAEVEKLKRGISTDYFANRYRCKDGAYRWLAWSAFPAVEEGIVYAAARDITERKQAEVLLQEQAAKLAEADRSKDEFLAMLAHELRNPLAPIRTAVDVLRRGAGPNQLAWSINLIDRKLAQLTDMVNDLLDVARITRGRIRLKKVPIDLRGIANEAVETVRPLFEARHHAFRATMSDDAVPIEADPLRMGQVLINLLNNAAKYTKNGGLIELDIATQDKLATIRVRDNGMGIASQTAAGLFDVFAQAERSLDRAQGGLGLGLTLVKRLTEMHGGRVEVESAGLGLGSTFTVTLPLLERIPAETGDDAVGETRSARSLRVLVVDDDPDVAESLGMLVETLGHDVKIAPDGPAALAAARGFDPQVCILDVGLPGMDGCELAAELRRGHKESAMLLIALTGYGDEEMRERVRRSGFDHHLLKPCDSETLENLLAGYGRTTRD